VADAGKWPSFETAAQEGGLLRMRFEFVLIAFQQHGPHPEERALARVSKDCRLLMLMNTQSNPTIVMFQLHRTAP
jgi:hypothetical protein